MKGGLMAEETIDKTVIGDLTAYTGDCLEVMQTMAADSVHCIVTSPPY